MSVYAEVIYFPEPGNKVRYLVRIDNKDERAYLMKLFVRSFGYNESIRPITREDARREYDLRRFNEDGYLDYFTIYDPERGGTIYYDAIEPTAITDFRYAWRYGLNENRQNDLF